MVNSNIESRDVDDDNNMYQSKKRGYLNGKFLASTQWEEIKLKIATSDVWLIYGFEVSSFGLLWSCSVNQR